LTNDAKRHFPRNDMKMPPHNSSADFTRAGTVRGTIDVLITYKIIELFSEGLYSSPSKAIEELVSNAFDAGATHVHIILPADLADRQSTIVVLDDGGGMTDKGFQQHWLIGTSNKRTQGFKSPRGRKQIGKFGIGKLATYVLANEVTHISKAGQKYFAATMNYTSVPGHLDGVAAKKPVQLPLRELTEGEAKAVVSEWTTGTGEGYSALRLFGRGSAPSWTIAILSDLKPMAAELQVGRLKWVLSTALPLRDDFDLFLDGERIESSKLDQSRVGRWHLGKDITSLPKPAPDQLAARTDSKLASSDDAYFGLTVPSLGRVTGYIELFEEPIDTGKSEDTDRSNGFFVYVRGRLVNIDDAGFGIDRNKLRHGTFSRFRMVINADGLDKELRSSRESLRFGPLFNIARNIAHAGFNFARNELEQHDKSRAPGSQLGLRLAASPASLTNRPLASLVQKAFAGDVKPRFVALPEGLSKARQTEIVNSLREADADSNVLVTGTELDESLGQDRPIAVFDAQTRTLRINALHPFVAYFLDDYELPQRSVPLELLAMSEVLLEAQLHSSGMALDDVNETLDVRDTLFRHLARASGRRNARLIAQDLLDAASNQSKLEIELVSAFDALGYEAVPLGGPKKPDGKADAWLAPSDQSQRRSYSLTLEAKSKEDLNRKVTAKTVGVSTVARHRRNYEADFAAVVGPDFPTSTGEVSALSQEIRDDRAKNPGKGITLIRLQDLARIIRLVPVKRIGLDRLRELFMTCSMPEDVSAWIDAIESEDAKESHFKDILEVIHSEQRAQDSEPVDFGALRSALRLTRGVVMSNEDLIQACRALEQLVPEWLTVNLHSVEVRTRPEKIIALLPKEIITSAQKKSTQSTKKRGVTKPQASSKRKK
jgi:hypothetical protein